MTDELQAAAVACAECGVAVACNPGPACWCAALPAQPLAEEDAGCLCRDCLARRADRLLGTEV
jgi:hypothetical protein